MLCYQYIGNKVYENGVLKRILLPNGYISNGNYYFYLRDHLGNNVVTVNYDFHARTLEEYGSFTTMAPLAEKYYSISPYAYCAGNPIRFIDPDGRDVWEINNQGEIVNQIKDKSQDAFYMVAQDADGNYQRTQTIDADGNAIDVGISFEYGTVESQRSISFSPDGKTTDTYDIYKVRGDNNGTFLLLLLISIMFPGNKKYHSANNIKTMQKSFLIILSVLCMFSTNGQQLGKETWTEITHEVKQFVLINEKVQCELENLLFSTNQDILLNDFENYKYFHLYVKGDTISQIFEFWLSNYPYKSKNLIGFFILKGYFVFVHDELSDFLKSTEHKKKFSYTEHRMSDFLMREDDTPCWILEYKNRQFSLLHYPAKQ